MCTDLVPRQTAKYTLYRDAYAELTGEMMEQHI